MCHPPMALRSTRTSAGLGLSRGLDRLQDPVQEELLRQGAFDERTFVDDRFGYGVDAVAVREVGELGSFDAVGGDEVALEREAVCQAHGLGTVRSGGGDEDFQVHGRGQLTQLFLALGAQARVALGDAEDGVEQR